MPRRDSLRRQDRHRAAATGRQLGSPALPRSSAGRQPPPGPDRPCSPPSLALCRASLSWHVPGPHIRNWTRAYGLSRSNKTFTNEAAGAPQAEQHAEDTRDSSPPPHANSHVCPVAWVSTPRKSSLATASCCPGPVTRREDRDPRRALAPRLAGCPNKAPAGGTRRPRA